VESGQSCSGYPSYGVPVVQCISCGEAELKLRAGSKPTLRGVRKDTSDRIARCERLANFGAGPKCFPARHSVSSEWACS
jgi:hypothetical protein